MKAESLVLFLAGVLSNQLSHALFLPQNPHELLQHSQIAAAPSLVNRSDYDPAKLYPAYNFSVPIDHFHNETKYEPHSNGKFPLRYWYDATYYKPGGPVIVLAGGETTGTDRLPYLQKGIVNQLARATHGLGVILEHRYYGTSFPVPDLSVENLRFLDTQQALADTAYFAKNIEFEGLDDEDLTSDDTAWIVYGGSYAGAFAAFLRVLYPDIFWGAISSSGVPAAIIDYWAYWEAVRIYGPKKCVQTAQQFVEILDGILIDQNDTSLTTDLKSVLGLANITWDKDFANKLTTSGVGRWQGRNWDPEVGTSSFDNYCANITSTELLYPATEDLRDRVEDIIDASNRVQPDDALVTSMLNWIGFVNGTVVQPCAAKNKTQDQCYGSTNATFFQQTDLSQIWRTWTWQYCTQWGYYQTGSGAPADILPLSSRLLDVPYHSLICSLSFNISGENPDIESINKYGSFDIRYPRLAFVDGQADPWRWAGVHAPEAPKRFSTLSEPFIEIEGAVHHWDENGLFPNQTTDDLPPAAVLDAQEQEERFVKVWVNEYNFRCQEKGHCLQFQG